MTICQNYHPSESTGETGRCHWKPETETSNFNERNVWYYEMIERPNRFHFFFAVPKLDTFSKLSLFWSDNDIYFFSGWYCCSSVAADAVADVAVAVEPVFVACYHCHLPRSSYKQGASIKAAYPLLYHSFSFKFRTKENILFKACSLDYGTLSRYS